MAVVVGAAVVIEAVVVVVVVNTGNKERPGDNGKEIDSLQFLCQNQQMNC